MYPESNAIWAILLIVSPLAMAAVASLSPRVARTGAWINAAVTTTAAIALLASLRGQSLEIAIGGWDVPLGIGLRADALTGILLLATSVVIAAITFYAPDYIRRTQTSQWFWPLTFMLQAALHVLYLSADVFNLYVALELLSLSAVALVALGDSEAAIDAALRYLIASLVASLSYLLGVSFLYHTHGALDLAALNGAGHGGISQLAALGLMTAGLAVKGALFPMHFWLPRAHAEAPSPVSAMLSGLVVKAPFYVLMRLWLGPFDDASEAVALLLGGLGAAAILWGSLQALRQSRLKLLVAYSTVAQLGYLLLFFPLAGSARAFAAVALFIPAHAFAKAAMFLAAGNILCCLRHDRIEALDRIAGRMPLTLAAFGIAGVCIVGIPPSGNFIAKWLLIETAFDKGAWGWAIVIVAGSLLSAAYVFRVVGHAFTPQRGSGDGTRVSSAMAWVPFLLSLLALASGFAAVPLLDLLGVALPGAGTATVQAP